MALRWLSTTRASLLGTAPVDPTGYWAYMVDVDAGLNDGVHRVTAVAVNKAGEKSSPSAVLSLTIDTEPAATPVIDEADVRSNGSIGIVRLIGHGPA